MPPQDERRKRTTIKKDGLMIVFSLVKIHMDHFTPFRALFGERVLKVVMNPVRCFTYSRLSNENGALVRNEHSR